MKVMNCNASVTLVGVCGKGGGPNMDLLRLIFDGQSACIDAVYLKYRFDNIGMFSDCNAVCNLPMCLKKSSDNPPENDPVDTAETCMQEDSTKSKVPSHLQSARRSS
jgi:hypothetical protein